MARGGQDEYDPSLNVAPAGGSPAYLAQRASPAEFGALTGAALEQGGQKLEQAAGKVTDIALQMQGQYNETVATDAETQAMQQYGEIVGKYKSMEGLQAVNSRPQFVGDISAIRQKILQRLPNEQAKKAFNLLALRHEGYALEDVNSYAATQLKAADTRSASSALDMAASRAGDYSVASNEKRWTNTVQDIDFSLNRILTNQGYGEGSGSGMKQNADGTLAFDTSTQAGSQANAVYQNMRDKALGSAWEARIHALADDPSNGNVLVASQVFKANRDQIPPEAQLRLGAWLQPKVRNAEVSTNSEAFLSTVTGDYHANVVTPMVNGQKPNMGKYSPESFNQDASGTIQSILGIPVTITSAGRTPEKNAAVDGSKTSEHLTNNAWDFQPHGMSTREATLKLSQAGVPFDQIIDEGDHVHVGFGPKARGEVLEKSGGTYSPIKTVPPSGYVSQADYIRSNYSQILANADARFANEHPDDFVYQQQAHARVEQTLNDVMRQDDLRTVADRHNVYRALNGDLTQGHYPTSIGELTSISPEMKSSWEAFQANDPGGALLVETRILPANAGGRSATTGTQFNNLLMDGVLAPAGDPRRVKEVRGLWPFVPQGGGGDKAPLTNSGLGVLSGIIGDLGTPQGEANATQLRSFLQKARKVLSDQDPHAGVFDPKGEAKFTQFVLGALPLIKAETAQGKSLTEILKPKGDLDNMIMNYNRPMDQRMRDRIMDQSSLGVSDPSKMSPEQRQAAQVQDLTRAYAAAKTDEQRQEVIDQAKKQGFMFRPKQKPPQQQPANNAPPEVPWPSP